jgi:hypothetical protein
VFLARVIKQSNLTWGNMWGIIRFVVIFDKVSQCDQLHRLVAIIFYDTAAIITKYVKKSLGKGDNIVMDTYCEIFPKFSCERTTVLYVGGLRISNKYGSVTALKQWPNQTFCHRRQGLKSSLPHHWSKFFLISDVNIIRQFFYQTEF